MGLDMYLYAKNDNGSKELGYWRKANQVHNYFVSTVQNDNDDCGEYDLTVSDLVTLKHLCQDVLDDKSLAKELLPTSEGFFFGSTEYDSDYFDDLAYTVEVCEEAIACLNEGIRVVYSSSW